MRVLLINPPYDVKRYMGKLSKMAFVFQPFGLAYIASYLRDKGVEVRIFDSQVEVKSFQDVVREFNPEIIGITCVTALVPSTIELARILKKEFPEKVIIVGGIHPTLRPEDFLDEKAIDYVAIGEGEVTMYEFIQAVSTGRDPALVPGILCKRSDEIVSGPSREMIQNIDHLPPPALDLLPADKYVVSADNKTGGKVGVIFTSRGCPFNCIFCSNRLLTKGRYRTHSIERVCSEVENLIDNHQVTQLFVQDDNFAVDKNHAKEICREFINRGFHTRISWWAEARVDCVDEELLLLMAEANCKIISYGLESGNQRLLDLIKKNITLEQIETAVNSTKRAGIDIRASFILGIPSETREESLRTIKFAKSLKIDQVRFALATPFPGTELWNIAKEEGSLNFHDWRDFSMMSGYSTGLPVYAPKGRDPKELARLQRYANLTFFLRPRIVALYLRRAIEMRAFKDIAVGTLRFISASLFPDR